MKELEKQLKALGNERRLKIITLLARDGARSVGDLAEAIRLSFRSTSRHLRVLRSAGIIDNEQVGLVVFYRLNRSHPIVSALLFLIQK